MSFVNQLKGLVNLKIGGRIALALAVPALGLLAFGGMLLIDKRQAATNMADVERLATLAPVISGLVHEMQKERGASAGFLASKGVNFRDTVASQRLDTNGKRVAFAKALDAFDASLYPAEFAKSISTARKSLTSLDAKRSEIDGLIIGVPGMAKYYTGTIGRLLAIVENMAVLSSNAKITNIITAYTSFLQGKERAGIERAMGAGGFSAGAFKPAVLKRFIELIAQQQAYLGQFNIYASEGQRSFLRSKVSGSTVDEVARLRKIAIDSPQTGSTGGVEGAHWFKTITQKINLLKAVEDRIASDLKASAAKIGSSAQNSFMMVLATVLVVLVIGGVVVFSTIRSITKPVAGMTDAMARLAGGELEVEIPATERSDEIGEMAGAVQIFKDNAIERARLSSESEAEQMARADRQKKVDSLIAGFREQSQSLLQSVSSNSEQMQASAKSLSEMATQTTERASSVAAASEEASHSVQAVAAASEELSASIDEIARQVTQTTDVVSKASDAALETDAKVASLAESSQRIGEVVSLIQDIAEQTNLLALNATIEAARAGDAGKGFAVVASEVKGLAEQTAKATEAIGEQISSIQEETESAVIAIRGISSTMGEVSGATEAIAAAVEEQSAATTEISGNVQQAAAGANEVAENITGVTKAADENQESAGQVLSASEDVSARADELHKVVDTFLDEVAAA